MDVEQRKAQLVAQIKALGSVVVAFSAGVDSTYLLAMCYKVLGEGKVLAAIADSASLPPSELAEAQDLAQLIGVPLEVLDTEEFDNPAYLQNERDRCFHCKDELFQRLWKLAYQRGLKAVAYGANVDDHAGERPGMQAAQRHKVAAPLLAVGLDKETIRFLAQELGLPNHDKPTMACLASRIPFGQMITVERLIQVAQAEAFIRRELGVNQVRVRHHEAIARIEVEPGDFPLLTAPANRLRLIEALQKLGFTYVTIDLAGWRSGSMHEERYG
jgi:uncharacterized protein